MPDLGGSIAVAHKDYDVRGGGERVAEALATLFDCPLYVGCRNAPNEPFDGPDIRSLPIGPIRERMVDVGSIVRSLAYLTLWQQDSEPLCNYDVVVTSGNEPLWYTPPDDQAVVAYTHATPRLLTDRWHGQQFSGISGRLAGFVKAAQRSLYWPYHHSPDVWVANSDLVARRLERYWSIPDDRVRVVYPPTETDVFGADLAPDDDYHLALSRLSPSKRIDELISAFDRLPSRLVIAGDGPERERLEAMARDADGVDLIGYVSEREKRRRMSESRSVVFNGCNEDFGMVPVEAFASGTPVIGISEGFTQFQILEGKNGLLFGGDDRSERVGALVQAVERFERERVSWDSRRIESFAERFGVDQFNEGMLDAVDAARKQASVDVDWTDDSHDAPSSKEAVLADGGNDG